MWALLRRRECYCVMCPDIYKEGIQWENVEFLSRNMNSVWFELV